MALSNQDREMLWIEAWSDLYDWVAEAGPVGLYDADWRELSLPDAQGRIQREAYAGRRVQKERAWYGGKPCLRLTFVSADG